MNSSTTAALIAAAWCRWFRISSSKTRKFRLILVEYPILGPESDIDARFALAAARQDTYGPFHKALMYSTVTWTEATMVELGDNLGLDGQKLLNDASSPETTAILAAYRAAAKGDDIDGTPTFVIGDMLFIGTLDEMTLRELVRVARTGQGDLSPTGYLTKWAEYA